MRSKSASGRLTSSEHPNRDLRCCFLGLCSDLRHGLLPNLHLMKLRQYFDDYGCIICVGQLPNVNIRSPIGSDLERS
jgi:hypothetical protein